MQGEKPTRAMGIKDGSTIRENMATRKKPITIRKRSKFLIR